MVPDMTKSVQLVKTTKSCVIVIITLFEMRYNLLDVVQPIQKRYHLNRKSTASGWVSSPKLAHMLQNDTNHLVQPSSGPHTVKLLLVSFGLDHCKT